MKKFLEAIEENEELKNKVAALNAAPNTKPADLIALAKEYGFDLTEKDFIKTMKENSDISEEELDAVTGGYAREIVDNCRCVSLGFGGYA